MGAAAAPFTPADCSLWLEVFEPVTIYDDNPDVVAWEVSTDPRHDYPYLLAPRNYAEQEIDPIRSTASIGTVEVGVIDRPIVPGDQTTGFMTARVHDLLGRRCRLRRWISVAAGWQVIADGPAGPPRMDSSYAAYRWTIRDTRETERKLAAFIRGGVAAIIPHSVPVYGFGQYTDDAGDHILLSSAFSQAMLGTYHITSLGVPGLQIGYVQIGAPTYIGGGIGTSEDPSFVSSINAKIEKAGLSATEVVEVEAGVWAVQAADVVWRPVAGPAVWNVSRPAMTTATHLAPFVTRRISLLNGAGDPFETVDSVMLFASNDGIPSEFAGLSDGDQVWFLIRYLGPASEDFPYYLEGLLGDVLRNLYDGKYALPVNDGIEGSTYDPAGMNAREAVALPIIQYDPDAFDALVEQVYLRQTEPVSDARAWAETALYGPSGWMPTLDNELRISPLSRSTPTSVSELLVADDVVTVPSPNWQCGERTVSQIVYSYPRYFVPDINSGIETKPDGLAIRDVVISFKDPLSDLQHGPQIEEYDAAAFAAIGTPDGSNLPGTLETANLMVQKAKFDVLDRYAQGAQSTSVSVRRSRIPNVRAGQFIPWNLMHLPDRLTGLRGSTVDAAQILSLRDDDCVWRTLLLEESRNQEAPPGYADPFEVAGDDASVGFGLLEVVGDEESY